MKITKYTLASGAIALSLLTVSPALADSGQDKNGGSGFNLKSIIHLFDNKGDKNRGGDQGKNDDNHGKGDKDVRDDGTVVVAGSVTAVNGTTITIAGKDGALYTVDASAATFNKVSMTDEQTITIVNVKLGDMIVVKGTLSGNTIVASKIIDGTLIRKDFLDKVQNVRVGVVTAVSGTTLTLDSGKKGTTTVTTDGNTKVLVNGQATTSSALQVGSKVIVSGTTTATSTSGTTISAQVINIFTKGFGFLKHLFHKDK